MTTDELDLLLKDRLGLSRADVIAALNLLPAGLARDGSVASKEAQVLDAAGLLAEPAAYSRAVIDVIARMAWLLKTAYTTDEVAAGLGVDTSVIEESSNARSLWAIDYSGSWLYPAIQFDAGNRRTLTVIRGLDRVFSALPKDLQPLTIAGFLLSPQQELLVDGRPRTVRDWLSNGGAVEPVLELIELSQWACR